MLYDKRWDAKIAPQESKTVKRLKRARERVAMKWCQKTGGKINGAVCALTAITHDISHGAFLLGEGRQEINLVERVIGSPIIGWNDTPGRTQAEVVAAFDRAIELARHS